MRNFGRELKDNKAAIAIYGIVTIVYVALFLIIPFSKNATSWISFAVTITALILGCITFLLAFARPTLKSKIYGVPVFQVGVVYSVIQLTVGFIFCMIAAFISLPVWICLVVYILLFGAYAIGVVTTHATRNAIEKMENQTKAESNTMQIIRSEVASLCVDRSNRTFQRLLEDIKYSDPVSSPACVEIEDKMLSLVNEYRVNGGDLTEFAQSFSSLLRMRNQICKDNKK